MVSVPLAEEMRSSAVFRVQIIAEIHRADCHQHTKFFLVQQQNYANDLLKARGHLFLNEVYDLIGARRTKAGAQVGWIYDPEHDHLGGDGFVDFGMFDIDKPKARDFVNGYEKVIILDFNVDGVILDHI